MLNTFRDLSAAVTIGKIIFRSCFTSLKRPTNTFVVISVLSLFATS